MSIRTWQTDGYLLLVYVIVRVSCSPCVVYVVMKVNVSVMHRLSLWTNFSGKFAMWACIRGRFFFLQWKSFLFTQCFSFVIDRNEDKQNSWVWRIFELLLLLFFSQQRNAFESFCVFCLFNAAAIFCGKMRNSFRHVSRYIDNNFISRNRHLWTDEF